jgi:hypothetical protein
LVKAEEATREIQRSELPSITTHRESQKQAKVVNGQLREGETIDQDEEIILIAHRVLPNGGDKLCDSQIHQEATRPIG